MGPEQLRRREREVLERWRNAFGRSNNAEVADLVRTAHVIRDALRLDQLG